MSSSRAALVLVLPVAALASCSLINSFDDLKPTTDSGAADSAIDGDDSTSMTETGTDAPITDSGADGADATPVENGLIVIGGSHAADGGTANVLGVIAPATGKLIGSYESLTVPIIRYDGLRDLWYIFSTPRPSFSLVATDTITLSIRRWDSTKNQLVELSKKTVPTPLADETTVVLRNRIAYVAQIPGDAGATYNLLAIDTTDPTMPSVGVASAPLTEPPFAAVGTRSALTSASGGFVNLLYIQNCAASDAGPTSCELALQRSSFSTAIGTAPTTTGSRVVIANVPSPAELTSVSWGSFLNVTGSTHDVYAYPPLVATDKVTLFEVEPSVATVIPGSTVTFKTSSRRLLPMAIAECNQIALVGDFDGQGIFAVPMTTDTGAKVEIQTLGRVVQRIFYEPYTGTVLLPFKQSMLFDITAYTLSGTATMPKLARRPAASWTPPNDLQPYTLATKQPLDFPCK